MNDREYRKVYNLEIENVKRLFENLRGREHFRSLYFGLIDVANELNRLAQEMKSFDKEHLKIGSDE